MLRREFLQGSAIVGASLVLPRILLLLSSGMVEGGERTIARVLTKSTMVQNTPSSGRLPATTPIWCHRG